ncbi:MAG: exodeoxyribonuclease VII small subunit [Clostridia bacterium]|nr:exodeoxyribonuclease VII small subunit [Clostridia bacterium]
MEEKKLSFEEALERLEQIVRKLDNGSAKLEETLSLYEESNELVKYCSKLLDEAEQKVTFLEPNE